MACLYKYDDCSKLAQTLAPVTGHDTEKFTVPAVVYPAASEHDWRQLDDSCLHARVAAAAAAVLDCELTVAAHKTQDSSLLIWKIPRYS